MKSKFAIALVPLLLLTGIVQPPAQASAALTPTFATPIATSSPAGFTVQITNYDSNYAWAGTASPSGTVSINGTGLVTFSGSASATVTITTTRDGYSPGSQTIGLCVGTAPITISTSSQGLVAGETLTVNFNRVGKFCGPGNFKMITARSTAINGQGFLDYSASTQDLSILANRSGTQSQTVTYTRTITSDDEMKFFQFYFVTTAGAVTKTTDPVKVFPADYHEPKDAVVTVSIGDAAQFPYYFSEDTGISAFGDLSRFTSWYNCGAPTSPDGLAAIADPTIADTTCDNINSGGYSYIRGDLTSDGPTNISNSVLVSRLEVTDVFGSSSPFYSAAVTTPQFTVTSVSTSTAYVGGGETITVNGTGLTKSTILWTPNVGGDTLLNTTGTDNQITFTVPGPRTRAATSATISIRTAGGEIAGPSSITLTKATVATLSNLSLSVGTLSPTFSAETISYTATVPLGTTSMTVTPTFTGTGQTVTVNSSSVASGAASGSINLNLGSNVITIVGTAEDGTTTKTYTVTVTRPNPPTLSTPTLTATTPIGSSNTIDLSWTAVTDRSSYTVKIYFAEDLDSVIRTIANVTDTTLTISSSNFPSIGIRALYKISVTAIGDGENHLTSLESTKVSAATGSVSTTFTFSGTTITSSAFEGRSVAANISDIRSGGSNYAYKWFGGSDANSLTEISGANSSTYTPTASDRSLSTQKYLSVRVIATISGNTYTFRSTAIPVYTYPNATGGSVTAPSPAAAGTYTSGRYKVGQTVIGHPWQVMGTPWPTLTYQWYVCNTSAAAANVVNALAASPATCAAATGDGNSGSANRAGDLNAFDLPGHRFSYVVTSEAAGKFLTFTATLSNEATTAQGAVFTFTQSRTQHSGIIQTTPGFDGALTISGTLRAGYTLTAAGITATTFNSNPTGKISYQWQRCTSTAAETCSNIAGATRTTYKLTSADRTKYLRVVATSRNNATTPDSTSVTSDITGVITT